MIKYTDDILKNSSILQELNEAALAHSYMQWGKFFVEGSIVYRHPFTTKTTPFYPDYFDKRANLWKLAQNRSSILEIGLNAGHSALIMLLANNDTKFITFDICYHQYVMPCFEILNKHFPQIKLCYGDSYFNLPIYIKENPNIKFDLIHIDGSHEPEIVNSDFESAKKLSTKDSVIVFDDFNAKPINRLITSKIEASEIEPVNYKALGVKNIKTQGLYHIT
jgi:hypothetical protein